MRLVLFFLLVSIFQTIASAGYSQSTKITLKSEALSLVDVLSKIEDQSEYRFIYDKSQIDLDKKVKINFDGATLEEVLEELFEKKGIDCQIIDNQIVLKTMASEVLQQSKFVSGKVTDQSGVSLPGVTIVIKGTTQGIITDAEGNYSLPNVPEDATLVFSFVGMHSQEISVAGKTTIDVTMSEANIGLDEVVAIGYGTVKRKDLTGSVSSVKGRKLEDIPVTSAAQVITGQLAGVQVTKTEGSPDADIKIRVRGGGSVTQDNSPLLLVDGFPVDNLNDIAPTDIESIDVLKDASSTAIYGARGANGVILITTKGGLEGAGKVSYNTYYGIKRLTKELSVLDPYNYVLYQLETLGRTEAEGYFGDFRDWDLYKETPGSNWQDECLQDGFSLYNNLSFRGGTENTKYNISLTRNNEDEIMENSGFTRTNLMANLTQKVNNWLTIELNTMLSDSYLKGVKVSEGNVNGIMNHVIGFRPVNGIKDYVDYELVDPELFEAYQNALANPVDFLNQAYRRNKNLSHRYNGAASIKFSKNLSYRFEFGQSYVESTNNHFYGMTYYKSRLDEAPYEIKTLHSSRSYKMSNVISYSKNNFLPNHNLAVIVGEELNYYKTQSLVNYSRFLPEYIDPESALRMFQLGKPTEITTTVSPRSTLSSFFGRVNYDYKRKYYFSATFRADGSSKFAPGNQWGYFPSFGASWNISEEDFMESLSWLDLLKLRASYGEAGNNRISENAWQKTFSVRTGEMVFANAENYTPFIAVGSSLSNKDLKWETTTTRNLGLDFAIFNQRLSGTVEIYHNKTQDLLINMDVPASTGYSRQWQNMGQTSNKGLEVTLDSYIIDKKDLKISASFNIGFNKNRIDDLGGAEPWKESTEWGSSFGGLNDYLVEEGGPVGQMYGYETDGMYSFDDFTYNPATETYTLKEEVADNSTILAYEDGYFGPGSLKFKDQNGDFVVDEEDKVVIGDANPIHTGGFNLIGQYKRFDVAVFFNWVYGNDIYNASKIYWSTFIQRFKYRNIRGFMTNYFRRTNPETGEMVNDPSQLAELNKDADMWNPAFQYGQLHSWAIEDGSFLRLNTLTLGYTLPANLTSRIGIEKLRIYATAYNLWIWTNYSGWDPEVDVLRSTPLTPGVDYSAYPRSVSFNFGLNVEF